ncbi:MAG: hypothetical protein HY847_06585 [Betaproteobacteria bacterium]|nr:hypothetical protein [Betaproteobacteria bacterium]
MALVAALEALVRKIIRNVQTLGPAAVALQLGEYPDLSAIIRKTEEDTGPTPVGKLAYLTGFISAYTNYVTKIVDRDAVDAAEAKLSVDRDASEPVDLVRMMILKTAFAHSGSRATELVRGVVRSTGVSESKVKYHASKLAKLGMLERLKLGPKAVAYRVSHLGEAILARRMRRYEFALFLVDEAARDDDLRAAMQDEIRRTWINEIRENKDVTYSIADVILASDNKISIANHVNALGTLYKDTMKKMNADGTGNATAPH